MSDQRDASSGASASPWAAGLNCRCPRCGEGRLYAGFLVVREVCEHCGLDYAFADAGDGPAVFVMLIAGFIVCGSALVVEVRYGPPLWLHAMLWGPLILLLAWLMLPRLKAVLIALQYRHRPAMGGGGRERNGSDPI